MCYDPLIDSCAICGVLLASQGPDPLLNTSPLEAAAQGGERRFTRGIRAHTVNLLPDVPPELKLIEKHNIVSVSGEYVCVCVCVCV